MPLPSFRPSGNSRRPATFWGVAGPLMQAAGCEPIDDFTRRSAMLVGAVKLAGHAWRLVRQVGKLMADSPTTAWPSSSTRPPCTCRWPNTSAPPACPFCTTSPRNCGPGLRGAFAASATGSVDSPRFCPSRKPTSAAVASIPNSSGHPLIEQLAAVHPDPARVTELKQVGSPVIACLPGSRRHVVDEVLPGQIEVASTIARHHPQAGFLFAAADETSATTIHAALADRDLHHRVDIGRNAEILAAADLALVASGTATPRSRLGTACPWWSCTTARAGAIASSADS